MNTITNVLTSFIADGHSIEDLGKKSGFLLAYNKNSGWSIEKFDNSALGKFKSLLRFFGFYENTHLQKVTSQLNREIGKNITNDSAIDRLYRTIRGHWDTHKKSRFPWEVDTCINCFANEKFQGHEYCGKNCAHEYKTNPRPIGGRVHVMPQSPAPVQPSQLPASDIVPGYNFHAMLNQLQADAKTGRIEFYNPTFNPVTSIFGNFHPCQVSLTLEGRPYTFQCSEAAFQACKFTNPALIARFCQLDGDGAWRLANKDDSVKRQCRPDWKSVNVDMMRRVLKEKFQDPQLRALLLATGSANLVERTDRDDFWGDGNSRTGQNMLGRLLMELREELRKSAML